MTTGHAVNTSQLAKALAGLLAGWWLCGALAAAPADEHQLAVAAYNRGDLFAAMKALQSPAKAGYAPSQLLLGFILDSADLVEESVSLYRRAAEQDHPEGHARMANAYLVGRGVAKDEKAAWAHFSKAADGGHGLSIDLLSEAYLRDAPALQPADPALALAAVRRAAERGHVPSLEGLADAHARGRWGLVADAGQAAQWKARAAAQRERQAQPAAAASSSAAKERP